MPPRAHSVSRNNARSGELTASRPCGLTPIKRAVLQCLFTPVLGAGDRSTTRNERCGESYSVDFSRLLMMLEAGDRQTLPSLIF